MDLGGRATQESKPSATLPKSSSAVSMSLNWLKKKRPLLPKSLVRPLKKAQKMTVKLKQLHQLPTKPKRKKQAVSYFLPHGRA